MRRMKELEASVGGLSRPSKMPGLSYGTPAKDCPIGSILRRKSGSVCSKCYAHKGMYVFENVKLAQARRLEILSSNLPQWRADMIELLSQKYARKSGPDAVFRWHDSGDIQSREHFSAIVEIARAIPHVSFWLPTKEYAIVRWGLASLDIPSNLTVRVSAPMIGQPAIPPAGAVGSTVAAGVGYACPARSQGNHCGDCRACWDKSVKSVDYHTH